MMIWTIYVRQVLKNKKSKNPLALEIQMMYNWIVLDGVIEISQDGRNITTHKISSLRVAIRFDYGFVAQLVEHRTFLWKLCQEIDTWTLP